MDLLVILSMQSLISLCCILLYMVITFSWCVMDLISHRTDGIGLSAPQVGINVWLMVFNPVGERGEGEEIVLVNPKVQRTSMKSVWFDEGCLSFPRIYANVQVRAFLYLLMYLPYSRSFASRLLLYCVY